MGARVVAGPSCSVVVDRAGMYWLAGKVRVVFCNIMAEFLTWVWGAVEKHGRR